MADAGEDLVGGFDGDGLHRRLLTDHTANVWRGALIRVDVPDASQYLPVAGSGCRIDISNACGSVPVSRLAGNLSLHPHTYR